MTLIPRPEPFDFQQIIGDKSFHYSGSCQTSVFWRAKKSSEALTTVIDALEDAGSRLLTPQQRVTWNLQDISLIVSAPSSGDSPPRSEDTSTLLSPLYDFLRDLDPRLDSHPCTGKIEDQCSTLIDLHTRRCLIQRKSSTSRRHSTSPPSNVLICQSPNIRWNKFLRTRRPILPVLNSIQQPWFRSPKSTAHHPELAT